MEIPSAKNLKKEREESLKRQEDEKEKALIDRNKAFRKDVQWTFSNYLPSYLRDEIEKYKNGETDKIEINLYKVIKGSKTYLGIEKNFFKDAEYGDPLNRESEDDILRWIYPSLRQFKKLGYYVYYRREVYGCHNYHYIILSIDPISNNNFKYELRAVVNPIGESDFAWIYHTELNYEVDGDTTILNGVLYPIKCITDESMTYYTNLKKYEPKVYEELLKRADEKRY